MTTPTHAALGFAIGTAFGHPVLGIAASVLVDGDHFVAYARHGVLRSPRLFWKTITSNEDPYGSQRGWFHSLLIALPLSAGLWLALPSWGPVLALSYLGHIVLDALDSADYWPLYPFKRWNFKGPVRFFSAQEILVVVISLIAAFFFLINR